MPEIYEPAELASYMQRALADLDEDRILLHRELVTTKIRLAVGPARYDALTDVTGMRPVAFDLAKRMYENWESLRQESRSIDDYQVSKTYATETTGPPKLSEGEVREVRRAAAIPASFSITPS